MRTLGFWILIAGFAASIALMSWRLNEYAAYIEAAART